VLTCTKEAKLSFQLVILHAAGPYLPRTGFFLGNEEPVFDTAFVSRLFLMVLPGDATVVLYQIFRPGIFLFFFVLDDPWLFPSNCPKKGLELG